MYTTQQVQQQDELRTQRNFISLLSGALGLNDQAYAGADSMVYNPPGQYQTINPSTGAVAVQGTSVSSSQQRAEIVPLLLIALAVGAGFLLLRKG